MRAELAGRLFEQLIVDIGFTTAQDWRSEPLQLPGLLAFAAIEPITVPVLPLEEHVAEKLHAYPRAYGDGTLRSTREKDLVDLVLISSLSAFDADTLRWTVNRVFAMRGTHAVPRSFPVTPPNWGAGYRKLSSQVGVDPDVARGHAQVAAFLDPILADAPLTSAFWDHVHLHWRPVGAKNSVPS